MLLDKLVGFIGRHWRGLLLWIVITAVGLFWVLPNLSGLLPFLGTLAILIFQLLYAILFMIVQFGALIWFMSRGRTYWIMPGETGISFKDYRGQNEVLEVARRTVTLLRGVKEFKRMGGEVTRGILLVGPPGTGKSYLGQAIAHESGVPFGYASGTSFMNMFWGMDVLTVWRLYRKARNLARQHGACILFIDEIDAIGASRFAPGSGGVYAGGAAGIFGGMRTALNQLLIEMDPPRVDDNWRRRLLRRLGFKLPPAVRPVVLTMGATNIPDILDPALLRPGRFDRQISIDPPDFDGRKDIIEYYLSKVRHEEMPIDRMAEDTIGYTPVTIKYVINESVIVAHFKGRDAITYQDFIEAVETREWGLRQPIRTMKEAERRVLAYHETGHAFAQAKLLPRERVSKVTIIRHGRALGLSATKPLEETWTTSREELLGHIKSALASKAAEELFLGTTHTGVVSDLQQATQLAGVYVGLVGMGGSLKSAAAGTRIDEEAVERLLAEQYEDVKRLLANNADIIHALAAKLLEKHELTGDEVTTIIKEVEARRPPLAELLNEENRRIAYHEAGHAVVQALCLPHKPLVRISIMDRSYVDDFAGSMGATYQIAKRTATREDLLAEICAFLGGRAAEELFLGLLLAGSENDLKQATLIARRMVARLGLGGSLYYGEEPVRVRRPDSADEAGGNGRDGHTWGWGSSGETRGQVEAILNEQYELAKSLLQQHAPLVHALAQRLLAKQELSGSEVTEIIRSSGIQVEAEPTVLPAPQEEAAGGRESVRPESDVPAAGLTSPAAAQDQAAAGQ